MQLCLFDSLPRLSKKLGRSEKQLLILIKNFAREKGYCYAKNEYIAAKLNLSYDHTRKLLTSLKKKGCVEIKNLENERQIFVLCE